MPISKFFVHTVTVQTWLGVDGYGENVYAKNTVTLAPPNGVFADDSRKLVRNKDGEQVVSETTIYTSTVNTALFVPDSLVWVNPASDDDLAPERAARVIKVNANDSGPLGLPDHVAVTLT